MKPFLFSLFAVMMSCMYSQCNPEKNAKTQENEIRVLIEQLVFKKGDANNKPVISPGITDKTVEYKKRFMTCLGAYKKLAQYKEKAFPILFEHLKDKRQSINFKNHYTKNSVGAACYWLIFDELQDRPRGYSRYGLSRIGKDGKRHTKPYWNGDPFGKEGMEKWYKRHSHLNHKQKQIKCLTWLLDGEKSIGASDATSYFINILPLEIQILKRRIENGEKLQPELDRLIKIRDNKLTAEIPQDLLPK